MSYLLQCLRYPACSHLVSSSTSFLVNFPRHLALPILIEPRAHGLTFQATEATQLSTPVKSRKSSWSRQGRRLVWVYWSWLAGFQDLYQSACYLAPKKPACTWRLSFASLPTKSVYRRTCCAAHRTASSQIIAWSTSHPSPSSDTAESWSNLQIFHLL